MVSENIKLTGVSGWSKHYSASCCTNQFKSEILKFLKSADIGIDDIIVTKEKFNPSELPEDMPEELKKVIISSMENEDVYDISTIHFNDKKEPVKFKLEEESHGTQKLFLWLAHG